MIDIEQIKLFRSLFNGREDAFAIRWEKGEKNGYMPSYQFDPYHYGIHKAKGGTPANYPDKTLQPLPDEQVKRHLLGEQLIGIYPLLLNNTSHFIAADFDGDNWLYEARKFIQACEASNLPVYLERSRSEMVDMPGYSFQKHIQHLRVARYFYPYFNRQEFFQYSIRIQTLIGSFRIKARIQEKV